MKRIFHCRIYIFLVLFNMSFPEISVIKGQCQGIFCTALLRNNLSVKLSVWHCDVFFLRVPAQSLIAGALFLFFFSQASAN